MTGQAVCGESRTYGLEAGKIPREIYLCLLGDKRKEKLGLRLRASKEWVACFGTNAKSLIEIPWERGVEFSAAECMAIAASAQEFQRGESSEVRNSNCVIRL